MPKCQVKLNNFEYPIIIDSGLFSQKNVISKHLRSKQVMLVTNQTIADLYLDKIKNNLKDFSVDVMILPEGEKHKTLDGIKPIFDALIKHQHTRQTTLIALGGGVITDMTGFAAASYLRGVDYISLPTTLLAQVDASIGGKTGVNHPLGKNLIGAFYQPKAVLIDTDTLQTLPKREFLSGLAEVIKYGLILDEDFFDWLEKNVDKILAKNNQELIQAILRCCEIKASIVSQDEKEISGLRALLNLGHTFGHAIETVTQYRLWLHGEAVAVGMLLAADLSHRLDYLSQSSVERIKTLLVKIGLPVRLPPKVNPQEILAVMMHDKKNINRQIRLVLMKKIGQAFLKEGVSDDQLHNLLCDYLEH